MSRPTLLIVDDEPLIGRSLRRIFRHAHIWSCTSSAELDRRRLAAVDAAILDLELAGETGIDVAAKLPVQVPYVFFSGSANASLLARAHRRAPVVRKDDLPSLVAAVRPWLRAAARESRLIAAL